MKNINEKIENILIENKSGVKNYASAEAAKSAAEAVIESYAHGSENVINNMEFMVLYVNNRDGVGRFAPVINFSKFMSSGLFDGGYIGYFASKGFMQV